MCFVCICLSCTHPPSLFAGDVPIVRLTQLMQRPADVVLSQSLPCGMPHTGSCCLLPPVCRLAFVAVLVLFALPRTARENDSTGQFLR